MKFMENQIKMIRKTIQYLLTNRKKKRVVRINYNENVLFIHIPKNGGTSVLKSLGFENAYHTTANEIHASPYKELLKTKYSFAIVRNPYQRFLSLYNYARMEVSHYHNNLNPELALNGRHLDYEKLKGASVLECAKLLEAGKLEHDKTWNQWEPQYKWICDNKKQLLIQDYFKLEELPHLETTLKNKFDWDIVIPNLNKSKKKEETTASLDRQTKSIIENVYRRDFELFDYEFML